MIKNYLVTLLLFLATVSFSQSICIEKNITPSTPAPCSIEGSGIPVIAWVVQVGVYENYINPIKKVTVYFFDPYYVYYLPTYYTEEDARKVALKAQTEGFCDAVPCQDPFKTIIFL